jgi:glycogen(starch) synthase
MRVLLLGAYPPPHGGAQTHIVALREFFTREGIPCEVINLTRHRQKSGNGIFYPYSALAVLWLLLRRRYDVAHLHVGGRLSLRLLLLCLVCSWIPGKKVVLTFHSGGYPSSAAGRLVASTSFKGMVLRRLHGLIGVNRELTEFFLRLGVPAEKTRLITPYAPCGEGAVGLPTQLREFYDAHRPVIVTVGLLEPEYDLSLQIHALGELRQSTPGAGLAIIGSGSLEKKLREEIGLLPYREHILVCGDVRHDVTLRAIAGADVMLRTTRYDGDSIAVREAMHMGVPVIATENGMRPDGVTLIPISDRDALCRAVRRCLDTPRVRQTFPEADSRNLQAVVELYQELLSPCEDGSVQQNRIRENVSNSKYI